MKPKLILVEGLPGSGKTTVARQLAEKLAAQGIAAKAYTEGEAHPADLSWLACVTPEVYQETLSKYPDLAEDIRAQTLAEDGYYAIAYTKVLTENYAFYEEMAAYEVYDARVPLETFTSRHLARWGRFGQEAERDGNVSVFECTLLQNHVNELTLYHDADAEALAAHFAALLAQVMQLSPVLIYLSHPDVRETILKVAEERVGPQGRWIDRVVAYIADTPYGKARGWHTLDDAIAYFEARKQLEIAAIGEIGIPACIADVGKGGWDGAWAQIEGFLKEQGLAIGDGRV